MSSSTEWHLLGFPHDLLKPFEWRKHENPGLLPPDVRQAIVKYEVDYLKPDMKKGYLTLEQVIRGHGSRERYWERIWAEADRLSAALARLRYEYDYWHEGQADPFFISVYGNIIVWQEDRRRRLCEHIFKILLNYADFESMRYKALTQVNDLLREFPSDSRFPLVSLRTHHLLTDMLRSNSVLLEKCRDRRPFFSSLYLLKASIDEPEFHKLRELREFLEFRFETLRKARLRLSEQKPLQIGDDLYIILLSEQQVGDTIAILQSLRIGFRVEVFEWKLKKTEEGLYIIEEQNRREYGLGAEEKWEHKTERLAVWAKILDDPSYDYVAWISIKPRGSMVELAEQFIRYAESELALKYGSVRRRVEKPFVQRISLSPELLLSIAEGYNIFLGKCASIINPRNPDSVFVIRSFSDCILLRGLRVLSEALTLYLRLSAIKGNLHIPSVLSLVVAEPKHPFWRVKELFSYDADNIFLVVGGKMTKLGEEDIRLLRDVIPCLKDVRRGQFHELLKLSRRYDKEHLKLSIEGKGADGKIPFYAANKLCWLIDTLAKKYSQKELMNVVYNSFKLLEPFTKKER